MDILIEKKIRKFKERQRKFLEAKGKILFLYLDGIITNDNINLSEGITAEGLGYYLNKDWSYYFLGKRELNGKRIKTQSGENLLKEELGMNKVGIFEANDEVEIMDYLKERRTKIKINSIEKVREYNW
jgi:hypothetical protein